MDELEIRQTLARAEEIQAQSAFTLGTRPEVAQLVAAAEEAGLERDAVLQALRERLSLSERQLSEGDLVFAKSADDRYYPARVARLDGATIDVEFLNGGEAILERAAVRPLSMVPGQTLNCPWPNWGWWNCTVVAYDPQNMKITASDGWGSQQQFHISDVRINAAREPRKPGLMQKWMLVGAGLAGGTLDAIIMFLLMKVW